MDLRAISLCTLSMVNIWVLCLSLVAIWGVIPILLKKVVSKHPPHVIMFISAVLVGMFGILLCALFYRDVRTHVREFSKVDWIMIIVVVLAGSIISNLIYLYSIKPHNTAIVTALTSIYPVVTLILGMIYLKEHASLSAAMGILLITMGVALIAYSKPS